MSKSEDAPVMKRRKLIHNYTRADIANAINAIVENGSSIRRASYLFNVPRTTLATYLKSATRDMESMLKMDEEEFLFNWMTECCQRGFKIQKENIIDAAVNIVRESGENRSHPFPETEQGNKNYQKFSKKWLLNNTLKERKFMNAIPEWFPHIEAYLVEKNYYDIMSYPSRIFVCDEYRFCRRGVISQAIKSTLTTTNIMYTFSAAGDIVPPLVIYPYSDDIPRQIQKAVPKDHLIVAHKHGLVTPQSFIAYLKKVANNFFVQNNVEKPVVLFVDDNFVKLTLELSNFCKNLGIILIALGQENLRPTMNIFKDLDIGWRDEVMKWEVVNQQKFTLVELVGILQIINQKYIDDSIIMRDFSESGLFPWSVSMTIGADHYRNNEEDDKEIEDFLENVDSWNEEEDDESNDVFITGDVDEYQYGEQSTEMSIAEDVDISIKLSDFKSAVGKSLIDKFNQNQTEQPLENHAENVLFDIYKLFQSQLEANQSAAAEQQDDDYDLIEIKTENIL